MHPEIFSTEQRELLPLVNKFSEEYYLVGGTAIALQIGHRMSVDFDLFSPDKIKRKKIKRIIDESGFMKDDIIYEADEQLHIPVNSVKMTFYCFPHPVEHAVWLEKTISMPGLLDLAAMKAYALGGRAKWRDYVDLYFLLKYHHTFLEINKRAYELFDNFFNPRLFREELSFFSDIDYDQPIQFIGSPISEEEIKNFLTDVATQPF